jgi:ketopantoate reductase
MRKINLLIIGAGGQIGTYFMLKLYRKELRLGALDLPQPVKALTTQELRIDKDIHYTDDKTVISLGKIIENPKTLASGEVGAYSLGSLSRIELADESVIFVAVKTYDYADVQDLIREIVKPDSVIVYLVNGLSPEEKAFAGHNERGITNPLVRTVIMGGTDYELQERGGHVVRIVRSGISEIVLGNWLAKKTPEFEQTLERVKALFSPQRLRVRAEFEDDFKKDSFDKTLANLINPISALIGCTCGEVIDNQILRGLMKKIIEQGIAVGRNLELDLGKPEEIIQSRLKMYEDAGHQHLSSMGRDALLSALRGTKFRHENENIGIALAEKGIGVDTHLLRRVNSLLDQECVIYNQLQQKNIGLARDFLLSYWRLNRLSARLSPNMDYIINQYPTLPRYLERIKRDFSPGPPPSDPTTFIGLIEENIQKIKMLYI